MEISGKNLLNFFRYGLFRKRPHVPLFLIFNLTARCNMACGHCSDDVWGDEKNELSLDAIQRFSSEFGPMERIALTGGEPFLRKDLVEICETFYKINKVSTIVINSNGLETEKICNSVRLILDSCQSMKLYVTMSLDGFRETHDFIRTKGSFDKVIETTHRLKSLEGEFHNFFLGDFNCTINNYNYKELKALSGFLRNEFQKDLSFNILFGKPRSPLIKSPNRMEIEKTVEELLDVPGRFNFQRIHNNVFKTALLSSNYGHGHPVHCRAGSLLGQIYSNGDVHFCPSLPSIGNIKVNNFRDIWHGKEAKEQLKKIKNGGCSCNNICYLRPSLLSDWKFPLLMTASYIKTFLSSR